MTPYAITGCPACGRKGDPNPCAGCGRCFHKSRAIVGAYVVRGTCSFCDRSVLYPSEWCDPDHLPRPPAMDTDEFAMRAGLFRLWTTGTSAELVSQFKILADFLADRGLAEEAAARADWCAYAALGRGAVAWRNWTVPAGAGWVIRQWAVVQLNDDRPQWPPTSRLSDCTRARLTNATHNGRWFLCWPPGFVRFTGAVRHDPSRWRVTVYPNRLGGAKKSKPVETVWPGGYTTLLLPYDRSL